MLVAHNDRPVPLEEAVLDTLPYRVDARLTGYWARLVAKALLADLGPILIFAPRRKASEDLARELAAGACRWTTRCTSRKSRRRWRVKISPGCFGAASPTITAA